LTSSYSFESASGAETIGEIGVRVGASEKANGASEGFIVNHSIADQCSETEDIMRGESGRACLPERLIEWKRAAMKKIEERM
jgi:hypothetical protein